MSRPLEAPDAFRLVPLDTGDAFFDDGTALRAALAEPVPRIPPVYGYDERGRAVEHLLVRPAAEGG